MTKKPKDERNKKEKREIYSHDYFYSREYEKGFGEICVVGISFSIFIDSGTSLCNFQRPEYSPLYSLRLPIPCSRIEILRLPYRYLWKRKSFLYYQVY